MASEREVDQETQTETTGHEWDGIKELDTPMPRWWLWTFYVTIVWGVIYTILFPAWPLVHGATTGLLGYSSRGNVAQELEAQREANATLNGRLLDSELVAIAEDPELLRFATAGGAAVFRNNCSQCHGRGAAEGAKRKTCPTCEGQGEVIRGSSFLRISQTCPQCQGGGRVIDNPCRKCRGSGRVNKRSKISLKIPAGVTPSGKSPISSAISPLKPSLRTTTTSSGIVAPPRRAIGFESALRSPFRRFMCKAQPTSAKSGCAFRTMSR